MFSVGLAPSTVEPNIGLWEVLAVLNRLVAPAGAPKADLPADPETLVVDALGTVNPKPYWLGVGLVAELLIASFSAFAPALEANGVKEFDSVLGFFTAEVKGLLDGTVAAGAEVAEVVMAGFAGAFPDEPLEDPASPKLNFNKPVELVEVPEAVGAAAD